MSQRCGCVSSLSVLCKQPNDGGVTMPLGEVLRWESSVGVDGGRCGPLFRRKRQKPERQKGLAHRHWFGVEMGLEPGVNRGLLVPESTPLGFAVYPC